MLEFGNRSRASRRRRLAQQQSSSSSRSRSAPPSKPTPLQSKLQANPAPKQARPVDPRVRRLIPSDRASSDMGTQRPSPSAKSSGTSRYGAMAAGSPTRPGLKVVPPSNAPKPKPESRNPGSSERHLDRPSQLLARRPVAAPQARPVSPSRLANAAVTPLPNRPTKREPIRRAPSVNSPFLYILRLLILVIGVGAIAGTALSVVNPGVRYVDGAKQAIANPSVPSSSSEDQPASSASLSAAMSQYASGQEMTALKREILSMTDDYPDLMPGVSLIDLDTGNYLDINGTESFAAASMIKVPILVAFFQDVDAGKIQLDQMLTLQEADLASGSGEMQFNGVGTEYTALETATLMIIISDNTATNMLIQLLGGVEALNQRFRSWGLEDTVLNNLLPDLEGTNTMSPREMSGLMTMISQGDLLSLRSRDRLLQIMRRTYTDTLIPAGVGDPEAVIAHKTGDIGSLVGDVGLVDMPNGKRYAITTIMKRPHNDDRAQEFIRQINRLAYDSLREPSPFARNANSADISDELDLDESNSEVLDDATLTDEDDESMDNWDNESSDR